MAGRRRSILALGLLISCAYPTFTAVASETVNYTYDASGRLIQASRTGSVNNGIIGCYTYDNAGNRSNVKVDTTACAAAPPGFLINDMSAAEGTSAVFTVTRRGNTSGSYTINYATSDQTAVAGSDYTATSGTLTFGNGETSKTISVPVLTDQVADDGEKFQVTLSNASGGANLIDPQAAGTIEAPPSFAINSVSASEGSNLILTVTKTGATSNSFSVNYASANGTATSGTDFTAVSGTLTFLASDTTETISVPTTNDTAVEGAETVLVNLSGATSGATISGAQGTGTINDND